MRPNWRNEVLKHISSGQLEAMTNCKRKGATHWLTRNVLRNAPKPSGAGKRVRWTADQSVGFAIARALVHAGFPIGSVDAMVRAIRFFKGSVVAIRKDADPEAGMKLHPWIAVDGTGYEFANVTAENTLDVFTGTTPAVAVVVNVAEIERDILAKFEALAD